MMTPESRIAVRSGEEVNVGLVKDISAKMGKYGGGKMSQHHKNNPAKFLQLSQAEGRKMTLRI